VQFDTVELTRSVTALAWVFLRVTGLMLVAPVLGANVVATRVKIVLAVTLTLLIAPLAPAPVALELWSAAGLLAAATQLAIGVALGFCVQMMFDALVLAGQTISMTMGLGFATLIDPERGASTPVLSQFLLILGLLIFLALNGHVLLIETLVDSFRWAPVGAPLPTGGVRELVLWGGRIFDTGLLIALPAVVALIVVNLAMGVVSRAAPQLNLFAVGFPAAMLFGFVILLLSLPVLEGVFLRLVEDGFETAARVVGAK
jgi:flagellar biosynthetic protein FliR